MPTDTHGLPDRQPVSSPGEALTFPDRGPHSPGGAMPPHARRHYLESEADGREDAEHGGPGGGPAKGRGQVFTTKSTTRNRLTQLEEEFSTIAGKRT